MKTTGNTEVQEQLGILLNAWEFEEVWETIGERSMVCRNAVNHVEGFDYHDPDE